MAWSRPNTHPEAARFSDVLPRLVLIGLNEAPPDAVRRPPSLTDHLAPVPSPADIHTTGAAQ